MDFQDLMKLAEKNAKKAAKKLGELDAEVQREKNQAQAQIEAERRARLALQKQKAERLKELERRKEDERKKNFTIPKKNAPSTGVDPNKLKAYFEKQEAEKREKQKIADIEKEKLMKLRMQAHGGKATKKLGKHFGLNPIDLQVRFGGNNEHIETLQKRQWREEEDLDRESSRYRDGVYRALQLKKKTEEQLRSKVKEPHRMATSKANSLAGLCSRHEKTRDRFSPPKEMKKPEKKEEPKEIPKKKLIPVAPVDFKKLMDSSTTGNKPELSQFRPPDKKSNFVSSATSFRRSSYGESSQSMRPSEAATAIREREREKQREKDRQKEKSRSMSSGSNKPASSSSSRQLTSHDVSSSEPKKNVIANDKKKDTKGGRFVKGPTPPPMIPPAVPGRRYLPGDVRYKPGEANLRPMSNTYKSTSSTPAADSRDRIMKVREAERAREKEREKKRALKRERNMEEERAMRSPERMQKMAKMRYDQSKNVQRDRGFEKKYERDRYGKGSGSGSSSFYRGGDDNTDDEEEEDYEDEYESDMDDFIDDSGYDVDEMSRRDFEDTLKMVNRKYDKNKWAAREKMISERDMVSDYRRIQSEESFSKRAGMMEDIREAQKGRSVRL